MNPQSNQCVQSCSTAKAFVHIDCIMGLLSRGTVYSKQTWRSGLFGMPWTKSMCVQVLGKNMLNSNDCINDHAQCDHLCQICMLSTLCVCVRVCVFLTLPTDKELWMDQVLDGLGNSNMGWCFFGTIRRHPKNVFREQAVNYPITYMGPGHSVMVPCFKRSWTQECSCDVPWNVSRSCNILYSGNHVLCSVGRHCK